MSVGLKKKSSAKKITENIFSNYSVDEQVGFLMRVAMQKHTAIFAAKMINNLTPPQFVVMAKLYEIGPCTQNKLGRLTFLHSPTIKGVVERLGSHGYVITKVDPAHRRRRTVSLTSKGIRVTEAGIRLSLQISTNTLKSLNRADQKKIVCLLKKLI